MAQRVFTRARKRSVAWELGPFAEQVTVGATSSKIWDGSNVTTLGEETIVRIRGAGSIVQSVGSAALDGMFGALGIGIVTEQAFQVGLTAIPSPLVDSGWNGWMWHQFFDV